jgi:hypothetical protein
MSGREGWKACGQHVVHLYWNRTCTMAAQQARISRTRRWLLQGKASTHRPVDAAIVALQHILHNRIATAKQVRVHLQSPKSVSYASALAHCSSPFCRIVLIPRASEGGHRSLITSRLQCCTCGSRSTSSPPGETVFLRRPLMSQTRTVWSRLADATRSSEIAFTSKCEPSALQGACVCGCRAPHWGVRSHSTVMHQYSHMEHSSAPFGWKVAHIT